MEIKVSPMIERIEGRLERLGLSEAEVLRASGLPAELLAQLRQGKAQIPRGQRLQRLAEMLGTTVAYLVGLDPDDAPPAALLEEDQGNLGLLAADEDALLRAYRRLDVTDRSALLQLVRKLAGPEAEPQPLRRG